MRAWACVRMRGCMGGRARACVGACVGGWARACAGARPPTQSPAHPHSRPPTQSPIQRFPCFQSFLQTISHLPHRSFFVNTSLILSPPSFMPARYWNLLQCKIHLFTITHRALIMWTPPLQPLTSLPHRQHLILPNYRRASWTYGPLRILRHSLCLPGMPIPTWPAWKTLTHLSSLCWKITCSSKSLLTHSNPTLSYRLLLCWFPMAF